MRTRSATTRRPCRAPSLRSLRGVALGLCVALPARAQVHSDSSGEGRWVHESWTVRDGLPVNAIGGILQSRDGYLWIATLDGLVRYDGVRFTVFNASANTTLPTNRFNRGVEAPDGTLWFQTEDWRLVRYRHGRFVSFDRSHGIESDVLRIARDSSGEIWIGTASGAGVIRSGGDQFVPVAKDTLPAASSFLRRSDGTTWIGAFSKGIYRVGKGPARLVVAPETLESALVWSLVEDPAGSLWIGTSRGLWVERNGIVRRAESDGGLRADVYSLVWSSAQGAVYAYTATGVFRATNERLTRVDARTLDPFSASAFAVDPRGVVWHAVGAELLRDGQPVFTLPRPPKSGGARAITDILFDREGGIWLATSQGLDRITPAVVHTFSLADGLGARNVYPVRADAAGGVWVGTWGGGLSRIDATGRLATFPASPEMPSNIHSIAMDSAGRAWVIGNSGLAVCLVTTMRCRRDQSGFVPGVETFALYIDRSGRFWAGVLNGLFRREPDGWRRVPGWDGTHPVRAFLETRDGALWIATNGDGIARWDPRDGRFDRIRAADGLPSDLVRSLYEDAHGTLWVGTEGRGLAALDPLAWKPGSGRTDKRIRHIGARDGLYDETIHQILSDDAGRFWMNTNRGIFWVHGEELRDFVAGKTLRVHATSYTERDGLINREGNGGFFPAGAKTADGRLWFPTQDGVVMIDPGWLATVPLPPVVVERVVAGDTALAVGDGGLALSPRQRNLEIDYTASTFVDPSNVRFRYRLEPYDRDWIEAGNRRAAFYTRVPPGSYRFRVEVGSSTGTWNESGEAAVDLGLVARFWETSWFRVALVAAFALLLVAAIRWRIAQLRQRARELELVVADRTRQLSAQNTQLERQAAQLAELDRAKTRFFANVSHEFRTPLTLTIGPLEDMRARVAGEGDPQAERWLDIALRNARRLLRLVNQILDVAKLEAGQMKLARQRFDVVPFARGVAAVFESVALQRGVALVVTTPPALVGAFDPDALEKILTNLLSNALKFTPRSGCVTMTLGAEPGRIALRVADTGPGIPVEQVPFVFERFYQADESMNRAEPGTGIGLSLVKELVELHGGTIQVASGDGIAGTTFTVTLPTGDDLGPVAALTPGETSVDGPGERDDVEDGSREDTMPTLLVVDDSADLRGWIREHFAPRFKVYEAGNGERGIALARQHLPDMVISDVMMPGVDGFELCRTLRQSPETDFLPIVLLTAQASSEHRIAGLERGADDYLTKPFGMRELEARVDNLIALRRRLRERFASGAADLPAPREIAMLAGVDADDRMLADRIRAAIEANLSDPDFGVAELARAVFHDRSHLFRRTRELFGHSPSDLIRRSRIERGARLLEAGAGTVTDVAYAVGFNKVSHFCRVFQEAYGATPAAWRERVASGQVLPATPVGSATHKA